MISGEKRVSLQKNSQECFPQPPPAPQENTTYSCWQCMDCIPNNLPFWQQSPHYSVKFAAETCNFCAAFTMKPFNICTYKICCRGDLENCNYENECSNNCSGCGACLISLPKLPCCALAGVSAFTAGFVGLIADGLTYCGSKLQSMYASSASEYKEINSLDLPQNAQTNPEKRMENQIKNLLEEKSLKAAINFYYKNQRIMKTHPRFYPYKIFFICLAISCPDETITLPVRKEFILELVDKYFLDGYYSSEGWIPALLLEAIRSTYRHSSELLELVCELGANPHSTIGWWCANDSNYLLALAYADLIENPADNILFYKMLILRKYEIDRPWTLTHFILTKVQFQKLDEQLKMLDETERNPTWHRRKLNEELSLKKLPKNVAAIIGQYSALYSPVEFKENDQTIVEAKSISLSNSDHFEVTSESKSDKIDSSFKGKLFKHYLLPRYERLLFDERIQSSNDNKIYYSGF